MFRNEVECSANGLDDDGNGHVDDCHGVDFADEDGDPMDRSRDGTHVAGAIGVPLGRMQRVSVSISAGPRRYPSPSVSKYGVR